LDFFTRFTKLFLFDNSKSEEFDVFPLRVWSNSDFCFGSDTINAPRVNRMAPLEVFKALNIGAEFFAWKMQRLFPIDQMRELDVITVVNKLKVLERDTFEILKR
jgi:hypothetical protein